MMELYSRIGAYSNSENVEIACLLRLRKALIKNSETDIILDCKEWDQCNFFGSDRTT